MRIASKSLRYAVLPVLLCGAARPFHGNSGPANGILTPPGGVRLPSQAAPYLGESPPGATPRPFALHVFTRELHSSPVFSPRGDEVFWNEMEGGNIHTMRVERGAWSPPRVAPFSLPFSGEPSFSRDGEALYFLSAHSTGEGPGPIDENVWKVTRTSSGWSRPESLGSPVNDEPMHWGVSVAANGNLYFGQTTGSGDIFVSEFRNGRYQRPVRLGPEVNSQDSETTPEVAPDESYLVFCRVVERGRGPLDLYVSFRGPDGAWLPAVPVAGVNTPEREISPRLSPDGRYLFFLRTVNGDLRPFWVSSSVITDLRPR
jgi:Tol biopolymer transport system component